MFVKRFLALRYCMLVLLSCAAVLSLASDSNAVVLRAEAFNTYADGSLIIAGDPKWISHSGTLFDMQVVNKAAELVMDGSRSEDVHMSWNPALNGAGDLYYGLDFTVSVPDPNVVFNGDGEYFAHLGGNSFNYNSRMDVVGPTGAGDFSVGISSDTSTAEAVWGTDLTFNTTYRVVVRYDQTDNQAELWINPTLETDPSILGVNNGGSGVDVNEQFALRQSGAGLDETIIVDGIVVGTTFADVVQGTPEPSSLALMLLGLGGMLTRRRS